MQNSVSCTGSCLVERCFERFFDNVETILFSYVHNVWCHHHLCRDRCDSGICGAGADRNLRRFMLGERDLQAKERRLRK